MKSICILCSEYPNSITPTAQVFVQQLVWAMAERGVNCTVICPLAINLNPLFIKVPYAKTEVTDKGAVVSIFFPKFISFGQQNILGVRTARLTTSMYYLAILRTWRDLPFQPEVVYGHFLTPPGICASRISRKYNVSSFAAYGESSPWSIYNYGEELIKKELLNLSGIVAVSSSNQKDLENISVYPPSKVQVFPNGIHINRFYPRDKKKAREKFEFDQKAFIVCFLGEFSDRKGVLRVAAAVNGLDNVSVAFAGRGPLKPNIPNCIYMGSVKPEDVPDFLSAADVFVLPTLKEGCCNAIIEAMACGLPIISSDLPFNMDILSAQSAFLVNPRNIDEIRNAIIFLRDNPDARASMGRASVIKANDLTIEKRAKKIQDWIEGMVYKSPKLLRHCDSS